MEELIRAYKSEVQDPEQFERLFANCLLEEIQEAVAWVIRAIEDDLEIELDLYVFGSPKNEYLKDYLQDRAQNIGVEEPWFHQKSRYLRDIIE